MLASLLFPYDIDAPKKIDGWLAELEREDCILRYTVEGNQYIQVINWGLHQKIDHPSKSRIPEPREDSRGFARTSEILGEDRKGMDRKGEEGNGVERKGECGDAAESVSRIISHYQKYHPKSLPGRKERDKIRDRLGEGWSVEQIQEAIDGCHRSPFHCGQNDKQQIHQSLELIVRDSKHVQQFVEIRDTPSVAMPQRTLKNMAATAAFIGNGDESGN